MKRNTFASISCVSQKPLHTWIMILLSQSTLFLVIFTIKQSSLKLSFDLEHMNLFAFSREIEKSKSVVTIEFMSLTNIFFPWRKYSHSHSRRRLKVFRSFLSRLWHFASVVCSWEAKKKEKKVGEPLDQFLSDHGHPPIDSCRQGPQHIY